MELLLNLLWLTLVVPAIWIWQHEPDDTRHSRVYGRLSSSLLLMCILMLLFPVVSASDDLHPMRTEMEESSPFKRTVKQSCSTASTASVYNPGVFFARSVWDSWTRPASEICARLSPSPVAFPDLLSYSQRDSRGPPSAFLG